MSARDDNPRWLAALVTAIPVAAGAALVLLFPPEPRGHPPLPARVAAPDPTRAPEPELELELLARYP